MTIKLLSYYFSWKGLILKVNFKYSKILFQCLLGLDSTNEFIKVFIFTQSSQEMNEFVAAVYELEIQERSGYSCRECGRTFSTHPSRVEYVNYRIIKICQSRKICAFL